jgi:hypothetical protein
MQAEKGELHNEAARMQQQMRDIQSSYQELMGKVSGPC